MLFKSRQKLTLLERARLWAWPRRTFARSALYTAKRLYRLRASPHKIAIGCAAGVFASITPLVGVQMMMAGAITIILRGSLAAAMLGTFFGNPLSWPLIWGATYALGRAMIGNPGPAEAAVLAPGADPIWPVLYPMLIGSIPIGLASAAVSYGVVARGVELMRQRKASGSKSLQMFEMVEPSWRLW